MPEDEETSSACGVARIPRLVLIDQAGIVRLTFSGNDPKNLQEIEKAIEQLLAEGDTPGGNSTP